MKPFYKGRLIVALRLAKGRFGIGGSDSWAFGLVGQDGNSKCDATLLVARARLRTAKNIRKSTLADVIMVTLFSVLAR